MPPYRRPGQAVLVGGESLPGFDLQKGVDSERMPQAVYGRGAKVGAADNMPYLFNTDGSDGLVKDQADPFWSEATVPGPGQQIGVVSVVHQVATHIQIVLQLGVYRCRQPVSGGSFFKLGLFDIKGPLQLAIVMLEQSHRFRYSHPTAGQQQDRQIHRQILHEASGLPADRPAYSQKQLIHLLGREV